MQKKILLFLALFVLALFLSGCVYPVEKYVDNGNGIISDNVNNLMWKKDNESYSMNWFDAKLICESDTTGGYSDWRLPTVVELVTFVDYSCAGVSINCTNQFVNIVFDATGWESEIYGYWSSTPVPTISGEVYYLDSYNGNLYSDDKYSDNGNSVRCVRSN